MKKEKTRKSENRTTNVGVVVCLATCESDRSIVFTMSTPLATPDCFRLVRHISALCVVRDRRYVALSVSLPPPPCSLRSGCRLEHLMCVKRHVRGVCARGWPNPVQCAWVDVADVCRRRGTQGTGVAGEPAGGLDRPNFCECAPGRIIRYHHDDPRPSCVCFARCRHSAG